MTIRKESYEYYVMKIKNIYNILKTISLQKTSIINNINENN